MSVTFGEDITQLLRLMLTFLFMCAPFRRVIIFPTFKSGVQ